MVVAACLRISYTTPSHGHFPILALPVSFKYEVYLCLNILRQEYHDGDIEGLSGTRIPPYRDARHTIS